MPEPDCVSVGYGIIGGNTNKQAPEYKKIHKVMKTFADNNNFTYGKDVKVLTAGKQKDIYDYLETH